MRTKLIIPFVLLLTACGGGGGGGSTQTDSDDDSEGPDNDWASELHLSSATVNAAVDVSLAIDPDGNVMAVWSQYIVDPDGPNPHQAAASYLAAGQADWTTPETIQGADDASYIGPPQVAFDADGNAMAIWFREMNDESEGLIQVNRYIPGTGWGTPQDLQIADETSVMNPELAVASSGSAVAVWLDQGANTVWTSFYSPGDGWDSTPTQITGTAEASGSAYVAMDDSGNAITVWWEHDGSLDDLPDVKASRYNGTAWSTPVRLEASLSHDAYDPKIGMDAAGNGIAMWEAFEDDGINIYSNRYTAGADWGEPERLATGSSPELAVSANGNAVAIWVSATGNLRAAIFTPVSGWGNPVTIDAANSIPEYRKIAVNDFGDAVAVWAQSSGGRLNIWSNYYETGVGWSGAMLVEQQNSADAYRPAVVIGNDNNAVVAWDYFVESGDTANEVWVNRFIND
jgi:hypothetical protein